MSGSSVDDEISNGDGYEGGGSSDSDDDEDGGAIGKKKKQHRRKMGCGFGKEVVLDRFTKAKNQIRRIKSSRRPLLPSSSSSPSPSPSPSSSSRNASVKGKIFTRGGGARTGTGCKFCFSRPLVLETGSPVSDPNHPNFTHAMFKNLIENNDFYCKECNPHLD